MKIEKYLREDILFPDTLSCLMQLYNCRHQTLTAGPE